MCFITYTQTKYPPSNFKVCDFTNVRDLVHMYRGSAEGFIREAIDFSEVSKDAVIRIIEDLNSELKGYLEMALARTAVCKVIIDLAKERLSEIEDREKLVKEIAEVVKNEILNSDHIIKDGVDKQNTVSNSNED